MKEYIDSINTQYGRGDLINRIYGSLEKAGKDLNNLTREDIAAFEEFHIGGRDETRNLAKLGELQEGKHVLDIGCGIGGPARTLAHEFGCRVTGIDLTEEYCSVAAKLSEKVGLNHQAEFQVGNAFDLSFDDASFDIAWMQHVGMNIEDKKMLYSEISRVLKPGGKFIFHEILKGNGQQIDYPVFWANVPEINYISNQDEIRGLLDEGGFKESRWEDVTERAANWFRGMMEKMKKDGPPPLGLGVIVGSDVPAKAKNVLACLSDGRLKVAQACYTKG